MASESPSSSPSEGEIVESHSEKATTSLHNIKDNNVNPQSRHRVSVSRSPSPIRSPAHSPPAHGSRTRSRSPYRDPRGAKRSRDDDHYNERPRADARRFKVRYEDRPYNDRRTSHKPYDLDRANGPDARLSYDDRLDGSRNKRHKTRSRSPYSRSTKSTHARGGEKDWGSRNYGHGQQDQGRRGIGGDVGRNEVGELQDTEKPAVDEATLIEERRKRREAIKAKHRGQATPLFVQALALDHTSAPISPKPLSDDDQPPAAGQRELSKSSISANVNLSAVNDRSAPATPRDTTGHDSPSTLVVLNDTDLANRNGAANGAIHEDEPSAADYDPTMDMQEDRARQDNRQLDDLPSAAYDETTAAHHQDVLLPEPIVSESQARDELDMFADEDDMFADAPVVPKAQPETAKAVPVPQSKAVDMSMLDDWDDDEGYYKVILGELLDNRYHVQSNLGRGMFSGVVRATDQKTGKLAAIKIIRNNESMKKAGVKEVEILQKLALADPEDKKHVIRLERTFEYKGHLCMVFENLSINLREVLKKFGRDVGINLKAVRAYAQQMFLGLSLLRKCNVLHADLKPDNVLVRQTCEGISKIALTALQVNESRNLLKVCDLGSASDASENEITPYLVSRFYRAPEIILGMPYDFGIDVWSLGCTLFELYTGKILFTGRSNNQMLRAIMECRGKFSHKILRKAEFGRQHFDDLLNFRSIEKDKLTGKDVVRILNFTKPARDLRSRLLANAKGMNEGEVKELYSFIDLLERCLNLNAEKRCTPMEALKHPFITRAKI
ncbi:MAG: hypothetical protein Q9173_005851 [Seirophora scorigena]